MSYFQDFPNTNFYNQDLGWLIRKYKELNGDVKILQHIYDMIKEQIKDITIEQLQEWLDDGTLENYLLKAANDLKIYNPLNYGCKGDGVTDDTLNFQKCIDDCVSNGGVVLVPDGVYIIDCIEIYGGCMVIGQSIKNTVIKEKNGGIKNSLILMSGSYTSIRNIQLQGNNDGTYDSSYTKHGISFVTSHEDFAYRLLLEDLYINSFTGNGIYLNKGIYGYLADTSFNHIMSYYNARGMYINENSDFKISDCTFAENRFEGIYINSSSIRIENTKCYLNGVGTPMNDPKTRFHCINIGSYGASLSNIICQENYGDGIHINGGSNISLTSIVVDASGIGGFTNEYNLKDKGDRIPVPSSHNAYYGINFNNGFRINAMGIVIMNFLSYSQYGQPMTAGFHFNNGSAINLNGTCVIENTATYDGSINKDNQIQINDKLLGKLSLIQLYTNNITLSDVVTGGSGGSFKLDIENYRIALVILRIGRSAGIYDNLVVSISKGNGNTCTHILSNNTNISVTDGSVASFTISHDVYSVEIVNILTNRTT